MRIFLLAALMNGILFAIAPPQTARAALASSLISGAHRMEEIPLRDF